MAADPNPTSTPTAEDCYALLAELGLTIHHGTVGIGADGFFVIIYAQVKRPAMIRFRGWPIEYKIGGGWLVSSRERRHDNRRSSEPNERPRQESGL